MRIVVALGGNALGNSPAEQMERVRHGAEALSEIVEAGHSLILTHGNGPQVGSIQLAFEAGRARDSGLPVMPLPECTAMSQGYIGYHLQNGLRDRLSALGLSVPVVSLVTMVEVDDRDPAFETPTKPIGMFYTKEEAEARMATETGALYKEDAGRGWRRVVASPKPVAILERDSIRALSDGGAVVIACGGGGVPVVRDGEGGYRGVPAVIDKDFAAAKLAAEVHADRLVILTAVDRVALDWGKPTERRLAAMTVAEAEQYCREGQFAPGSMLPKVQAAVAFAKSGGTAVIASLEEAGEALSGRAGTSISSGAGALGAGAAAAAFMG